MSCAPVFPRFTAVDAPLSRINRLDTAFRITTETDTTALLAGIREIGLINPPLLFDRGGEYQIISGFRRIDACARLEWPQIPARIAAPETPSLVLAKCAIAENAQQRPLNIVELAQALKLLSQWIQDPAELAQTAVSLGLPANPDLREKLLAISGFAPRIKEGFARDIIALPLAPDLARLDDNARLAVAEIFMDLKPSLNKQRELFIALEEIAAREGVSLHDLTQAPALRKILNHPDEDRNQRMQRLRLYLKQRRYPRLTGVEEKIKARLAVLTNSRPLEITPPPYLEGTEFSIRFKFHTPAELTQRIAQLAEISTHPALTALIDKVDLDY